MAATAPDPEYTKKLFYDVLGTQMTDFTDGRKKDRNW